MSLPKISVITVSYNQGEFIRQNIESVLAQRYPNLEHIVVDGGSSDGTLEVLKSYPHLQWSSKPDKGQTDALNQGFARAQGEIIAWLNSDDWYAPGVFHDVAQALQQYPVVLGCAEHTDRAGRTTEFVENLPRGFFDILKYWVYYSIPAQPAVFFRREALERVRRSDGAFLDEDIEFGMDFELWLRMSRVYEFTRRIPRTLAYLRLYGENKTSKSMAAAYNEFSRLFKRHENLLVGAEHKFSFVIPLSGDLSGLDRTLQSIGAQTLRDFEVLLVEYGGDRGFFRNLRREVLEFCGKFPICLRTIQAEEGSLAGALHAGGLKCGAPLICFLMPGAEIDPDFCLQAGGAMGDNAVAVQLPLGGRPDLTAALATEQQGRPVFSVQAVFGPVDPPRSFLLRKAALMELGGLRRRTDVRHALRDLLLRLIFKGWQVRVSAEMKVRGESGGPLVSEAELMKLKAGLILDSDDEFRRDPMAALRVKHGFGLAFPESLVQEARQLAITTPGSA